MSTLTDYIDAWVANDPGRITAAVTEHASWGWFAYRRKGEGMEQGYQSPPVTWGLSSERKRPFFKLCAEISVATMP